MMETLKKTADLTYDRWVADWLHQAADNGRAFPVMKDFLEVNSFLTEKTIVICGSGPSLMADIDLMRLKRKHLVVFANHSNAATLLYHGIVPDFIVVTDAGEPTETRFTRDILKFSHELRRDHAVVILATTARTGLAKAVVKAKMELRWFKSLPQLTGGGTKSFEFVYGEAIHAMNPQLEIYVLQAGSVSNTSVMIAHTMVYNGKMPKVNRMVLSGVDCGYPGGITRCDIVEWDGKVNSWKVTQEPTSIGPEIKIERFAGYPTDAASLAYRGDLQLLVERLQHPDESMVPPPPVLKIVTSSNNFLADFLDVEAI
jgi:hypothetical protein